MYASWKGDGSGHASQTNREVLESTLARCGQGHGDAITYGVLHLGSGKAVERTGVEVARVDETTAKIEIRVSRLCSLGICRNDAKLGR